jgi:hypothetical protein
MGQNFLYRANFKIKKKGKRLDFQTLISVVHGSVFCSFFNPFFISFFIKIEMRNEFKKESENEIF